MVNSRKMKTSVWQGLVFMSRKNLNKCGVSQNGIIESVNGGMARVRILRHSACDSCQASAGCKSQGSRAAYVDVDVASVDGCEPGDCVVVEMSPQAGHKAVAVGFVVPLALFVAVLLGAHYYGYADDVAALAAIGVLLAYYAVLYVFRAAVNSYFRQKVHVRKVG